MRIESLIKPSRAPSRNVSVHGTNYEFIRVADNRYVAEVADEEHAQILLRNPKAFREFTESVGLAGAGLTRTPPAKAAPVAAPTPAPTPSPQASKAVPAPPAAAEPAALKADPDNDGPALALLSCTPAAIKKQLDKTPPPAAVLQRAVELESASKKPRQQVLSHMKAILSAVQA